MFIRLPPRCASSGSVLLQFGKRCEQIWMCKSTDCELKGGRAENATSMSLKADVMNLQWLWVERRMWWICNDYGLKGGCDEFATVMSWKVCMYVYVDTMNALYLLYLQGGTIHSFVNHSVKMVFVWRKSIYVLNGSHNVILLYNNNNTILWCI